MAERNASPVPITLGNITRGAVLEAFAHELALVLENIADLATPATAKRAITLKVEFAPQADRLKVDTTFVCTTKLAGVETRAGQIYIAPREGGGFVALDQDPRQMMLWPAPASAESNTIEFAPAEKKEKGKVN